MAPAHAHGSSGSFLRLVLLPDNRAGKQHSPTELRARMTKGSFGFGTVSIALRETDSVPETALLRLIWGPSLIKAKCEVVRGQGALSRVRRKCIVALQRTDDGGQSSTSVSRTHPRFHHSRRVVEVAVVAVFTDLHHIPPDGSGS